MSKLILKVKWTRRKRNFRISLIRKTKFWISRDNSWKKKGLKWVRKKQKSKWTILDSKLRWSNCKKRKMSWKASREESMIQQLKTNCK